ncbi:MAG: DUF427 domain-containing protein [Rhodospirillaceae bacterium]|nr:DUF427 domain-containing protein [Rhodospirillaceae bacterium]
MTLSEDAKRKIEEAKKNGYRIDIAPYRGRARVTWNGVVVAESTQALALTETRHATVIYIPRADTDMSLLQRTAHTTHCPFKGDANYFSLVSGANRADNAVWTYENPIPDVAPIKDHLAFYTKAMGASFGIEVDAPAV